MIIILFRLECTRYEKWIKGGMKQPETAALTQTLLSILPILLCFIPPSVPTNSGSECLAYKHHLNAYRLGIAPSPDGPLPRQWVNFLNKQDAIMASQRPPPHFNQCFHQGTPNFQQPPINNISMPANTLETIIQAIGQVAHSPPAPTPRIPPIN